MEKPFPGKETKEKCRDEVEKDTESLHITDWKAEYRDKKPSKKIIDKPESIIHGNIQRIRGIIHLMKWI